MGKRKLRRGAGVDWKGLAFVLIILSFAIAVLLFSLRGNNVDLTKGEDATDFCFDKCVKDVVSSNYNSTYNFIRCECVANIKMGDGKYSSVVSLQTHDLFFDSQTFENITREEVRERVR